MTQSYPAVFPGDTPVNPNYAKPRYGTPGDWIGGVFGADAGRPDAAGGLTFSTANLAVARMGGAANDPDYVPRNQNAKLLAGQGTGTDIGRRHGTIGPQDPYPNAATPAPQAPTVTSLAPNTAAATALPVTVVITGTNFTPWSLVYTGGQGGHAQSGVAIDATHMQVTIQKGTVAGTVGIIVGDHNVLSNSVNFTVT